MQIYIQLSGSICAKLYMKDKNKMIKSAYCDHEIIWPKP